MGFTIGMSKASSDYPHCILRLGFKRRIARLSVARMSLGGTTIEMAREPKRNRYASVRIKGDCQKGEEAVKRTPFKKVVQALYS